MADQNMAATLQSNPSVITDGGPGVRAVQLLLDHTIRAAQIGSTRARERTPLITAVRVGSRDIVELLLDHGANPDRDTPSWATPLAITCERGDRGIAELLLERGADVDGAGSRHGSPLEKAAWYRQEDLVVLLLDRGADPQRVMARGLASLVRISSSILHRLIDAGGTAPPEIVEMLAAEQRHKPPGGTADT